MKSLKPQLKPLSGSSLKTVTAGSWRDGKTTKQRGYSSQWRKARAAFLQAHPLCVYCMRNGKVTAANVVDHIVPHRGDMSLFWDTKNWQALCSSCHSSIKQAEEYRKNQ